MKPGPRARRSKTVAEPPAELAAGVQTSGLDGQPIAGLAETIAAGGRDAESGEIVWAHSIVELADALGVSRQTIYNWQRLPGCPSARSSGNYEVREWRAFRDLLGTTEEGTAEGKKQLEERLLKIKCEDAEFTYARKRGEWTENTVIADEINRLVNELTTLIKHALEERIPTRGAGKKLQELRSVCVEELDRLMVRIHSGPAEVIEKLAEGYVRTEAR